MGDLTNKQIDQTYDGLIKTDDENAVGGALKGLQDGVGNDIGIEVAADGTNYTTVLKSNNAYAHGFTVGSTGTLFGGTVDMQTSTVDFTNATVIGLSASDTTYDLGAVGAAGNINVALTGSDASNDVVTIQAGTNITLTDNGSNTFTIDAAGGSGGAQTSYTFTTGTVDTWAGPAGQDVIVSQVTIPAGTIPPNTAAHIEFRSPVDDGSEGQWNYTSFQISPTIGGFNHINLLGQQSSTGGGDPYMWYRSINVASDGTAYYKDTNGYAWPGGGGDPIQQKAMDWSVDNYFTVSAWCDAENATFRVYSPTIVITIV